MERQPKLYVAIIKAGVLAGTLDILAAIINYYINTGKTPEGLFKFIASGAFGKGAFTGGTEYIVAGVLLHYLIAFGFTILFFLIYPKIKRYASGYIITIGLLYGILAWCIMNIIVVPLSKTPVLKPDTTQRFIGILFIMFLIGLPIALLAKKHYAYERVD
jgi:hypothetical protein